MDQLMVDAQTAYQEGRYKKAIEIYQAVINKNPGSANAHQEIAQCYSKLRKFKYAYIEAQKALEINNDMAIPTSDWVRSTLESVDTTRVS